VALDLPARDFRGLAPGEEGTLFYTEAVPLQDGLTLHRWVMKDRKATDVMSGVEGFALSADGKKLLYGTTYHVWGIVDASGTPKPGDGKLATAAVNPYRLLDHTADRQPFTVPNAAIWGPKVMVVNDAAGSGGDLMPYLFRAKGIGPLVGTRTWGGLVCIWDVPDLVDGGFITAPRGGFYNVQGQWDVENQGVPPDVEVEQTPRLVAAGGDPQLEKAVQIALELLKTQEVTILPQPPDPVRVKRPGR